MDEKVILPTGRMDDSNDMTRRPTFIISIGRQRFEIRVNTTITQVRPRPAEVIPIDRDSLVRKAEGKKG
jgi:hypothetical protein